MNETQRTGFDQRLKAAAEAKAALLAKFRPREAVAADRPVDRKAERDEELKQVRAARTEAKAAKIAAAEQAEADRLQAIADADAAALDDKRGHRKERKALTKAEAKAKRDARYAARKAR